MFTFNKYTIFRGDRAGNFAVFSKRAHQYCVFRGYSAKTAYRGTDLMPFSNPKFLEEMRIAISGL